MYLHMCSSHPESTKKAIPYGLGVRIKRICSSNDNYLLHRKDFKSYLQDRGYNVNFIESELGKVDATKRTDLLRYNNKFEDHGSKHYNVKNYINCQSTKVVYAVFCKKWTKYVYVGETGDTLYQRQLLNLSRIKTKYPVAIHFYTDGHTIQDFSVIGLEKLHGDEQYRKTIENLWKVKLSTNRPQGVNTKA